MLYLQGASDRLHELLEASACGDEPKKDKTNE